MPKGRGDEVVYLRKAEEGEQPEQHSPEPKPEGGEGSPERHRGRRDNRRKPREAPLGYVKKRVEGEAGEAGEGEQGQSPEATKPSKPRVQRQYLTKEWKEETKKSMTVETKIPAYPTKEELLAAPTRNALFKAWDEIDDQISDIEEEIQELKDERRIIKNRIRNQNKVEYEELTKLITAIKAVNADLNKVSDKKALLNKELEAASDRLSKLEKKAYNGKILPEARLKEIIAEVEADYKNNRHTAAEEKKHIERLEKLKQSMPLAAEAATVHAQVRTVRERIREANDQGKPLLARKRELQPQIEAVREKLNLQKEKEKKKTAEEREAEKERRKKEWVESPEEQALRAKEVAAVGRIKELRAKKTEAKAAFEKSLEAYFAQQLEMDRIEFMWNVMDGLKEEDRRKKAEAELAKRREEEVKRIKAELGSRYALELDLLDSLASFLEQSKLEKRLREQPQGGAEAGHRVDEETLKKEKLVLMKSKKSTPENEGAVQPGMKKVVRKPKKQGEEGEEKEDAYALDLRTLDNFARVHIEPPKGFEDYERVAEAIQKKRDEYVKKREDEIAEAEKNPPKVNLDRDQDDTRGGRWDRDRGDRGDRGDRRGDRAERGPRGDRDDRGERRERRDYEGGRGERRDRDRDRPRDRDQPREEGSPEAEAPQEDSRPKNKPSRKVEFTYDNFPAIN